MTIQSFKDLKVWQRSITLNKLTYDATKQFPKEETYGLTSQMRRCAVSVASNIAEGSKRNSTGEFIQFIGIAQGSLAELETQVIIANEVGIMESAEVIKITEEAAIIGKMLVQLQRSLKSK
jgi:four helix bundle protein